MQDYKELSKEEKKEYWQQHLNDWKQSGLSQSKYCRLNNIKPTTFASRVRSFKKESTRNNLSRVSPEIVQSLNPPDSCIELILNQSITIKINYDFNPQLLQKVLETLGVSI